MSLKYVAVGWNRQKRIYDGVLFTGILVYVALFAGVGSLVHPDATVESLLIRAFGTLAFLMLNLILAIGPASRLDNRVLPLLYNRRHLGVATLLVGLCHGAFSLIQFHALGDENPFVSLLSSNVRFDSVPQFPFQLLGAAALAILFLLAATSHDFWLHVLTPRVWKALHMSVYLVYALLVAHVMLGALQQEHNPVLTLLIALGAANVVALHVVAGCRESNKGSAEPLKPELESVSICRFEEIEESRAVTVSLGGERIAVFRHQGRAYAMSNVCRHQMGPLGEGKIIGGCVTCPWHGYQYDPKTGCAPPPFNDVVDVYQTRIIDGIVHVDVHSTKGVEA